MKTINRSDYYKQFAMVSVNHMIMSDTSKCYECKDKLQEFSVFVGNDQRLSTLFGSCCSECLSIMVNKAIKDGQETAEKMIKRAEEKLKLEKDVEKYNL